MHGLLIDVSYAEIFETGLLSLTMNFQAFHMAINLSKPSDERNPDSQSGTQLNHIPVPVSGLRHLWWGLEKHIAESKGRHNLPLTDSHQAWRVSLMRSLALSKMVYPVR